MIYGTFMLVQLSFSWFWQNLNNSSKSIILHTMNWKWRCRCLVVLKQTKTTRGGAKTPLLSSMCAEREGIDEGVHAGFIHIVLCKANTLKWGKVNRELAMEKWDSHLESIFRDVLPVDAGVIHSWTRRTDELTSVVIVAGYSAPKSYACTCSTFAKKPPKKQAPTHVCAHRRVRTRVLLATSPVSGSLIKLTDAGPSGQAEMSGPSRSCHDMMDLSSAGCQAATQVHCPVGVHQKTLGKHPVDLICI